jgi:hypothetical protein
MVVCVERQDCGSAVTIIVYCELLKFSKTTCRRHIGLHCSFQYGLDIFAAL